MSPILIYLYCLHCCIIFSGGKCQLMRLDVDLIYHLINKRTHFIKLHFPHDYDRSFDFIDTDNCFEN